MNRFVALWHVREDEVPGITSFARALAKRGLKVVYHPLSPWPPGGVPRGVMREEIETGLAECCYGVVWLSRAFLARNWPSDELDEVVSRLVGHEERLIHVAHNVSPSNIAESASELAHLPLILTSAGVDSAAESIVARIAPDARADDDHCRRTGLNPRSLRLVACRECGSNKPMVLECLTAPPVGASGVLVCTECGRGYPIRNGVPQLLGEGAINPDEPRPFDLDPPVDLTSAE